MGEKKKKKEKKDDKDEKDPSKKTKKTKNGEDKVSKRDKPKKEKKEKKDKVAKVKKEKKAKLKKEKKEKKPKKEKSKKGKKKSKKGLRDDEIKKKKSKKNKSGDVETVCCICKDDAQVDLAGGFCNHVFCTPCLENLLHKPLKDPQVEDNHLAAPTLGRCPECLTELRQFDMKDTKTGKLKYKRNKDIKSAPFYGKIFQPVDPDMQLGDFCFDKTTPYMSFKKAISQDKDLWVLNDGTKVEETKEFNKGYHFDEATRTFHGTMTWQPVTFQGSHRWDVTIGFSKDFENIHVGVIHERKERQIEKKDKIEDDELYRHQYPLDGKWKLIWINSIGKEQTGNITVRNNEFQQGPYLFNINFEKLDEPQFRWPLDPVFAAAKSGVNLKKKPTGPKVGDRIEWETTHPAFSKITWERETIGDPPPPRTLHFGRGNNMYTADESQIEKKGDKIAKGSKSSVKKENSESRGGTLTDPNQEAMMILGAIRTQVLTLTARIALRRLIPMTLVDLTPASMDLKTAASTILTPNIVCQGPMRKYYGCECC